MSKSNFNFMVSSEQIQNTKTWQNQKNNFMKNLLTNKQSRIKISHGLNMSKQIGFNEWNRLEMPSHNIKEIVKELLT